MNKLSHRLNALLNRRIAANSLRQPFFLPDAIDFSSNDYLGLSRNVQLQQYILQNLPQQLFLGATGSRLLTGHSPLLAQLEMELAQYYKKEAALIFNSGYDANMGWLNALARRTDVILYDELIHASLHDAMQLANVPHFPFQHNNIEHLQTLLKQHHLQADTIFILVESVYSMDGDTCPLRKLVDACQPYEHFIFVDEAHATGIFGAKGEGLVVAEGLEDKIHLRLHTFGKAIGTHGAALLSNELIKTYLYNYARSLIYTTFLPPHTLHSIQAAHRFLAAEGHYLIAQLHQNIAYFRQEIQQYPQLTILESHSPIQIAIIPTNTRARAAATHLQAHQLDVRPILSPTVPIGQERLRICIHSFNTQENIKTLATQLGLGIWN